MLSNRVYAPAADVQLACDSASSPPLLQVARLRERLEASGVDCEALLADIVTVGGEEDLT